MQVRLEYKSGRKMGNPSKERIVAHNPDPLKKVLTIDKSRYEAIRPINLEFLRNHDRATYSQIAGEVERRMIGQFEGFVCWYTPW